MAPKLGVAFALVALTGCRLFMRDTTTPIPTLVSRLAATGRTETLVVFLRGGGGSLEDFEKKGIMAELREAGVRADTIVVDSHLGYYFEHTAIIRLQADVLVPARQRGYRRIILAGVSIGGLGALLCERDYPGSVDALVLLAPNLGDDDRLFDQIDGAGGPVAWAAGRDPLAGDIYEQLWTFLGTKTAALPVTWLLAGRDDRYGRGHRFFAALLPATRVATIAGGHDWPTWRALWRDVSLNSDLFRAERAGGIPAAPLHQ